MGSKQMLGPFLLAIMDAVLDIMLPLVTLFLNISLFVLFTRSGYLILGGLAALSAIGPYVAVTYLRVVRICSSQHHHDTLQLPKLEKGVWAVPQCLANKLDLGSAAMGGKHSKISADKCMESLKNSMKSAICTLWALPVVVPHLFMEDVLALTTVFQTRVRHAMDVFAPLIPLPCKDVSDVMYKWVGGTNVKVKESEGWLFNRRIIDLFFHSCPQTAIHLVTFIALHGQYSMWGYWPRILWVSSVSLGLCELLLNTHLVMGFASATGMKMGEVIWFSTDNPGVVPRLSDNIVFLYRDQCEYLEIDVDNIKFLEIWDALLQILKRDLVNLRVIHVVAKGKGTSGDVKKGLKDLFEVVRSKEGSCVTKVLVDLSVLGVVQL